MKKIATTLTGVYLVELDIALDERGSFQRLWGQDDLEELGLERSLNNVGRSSNCSKGTVRGMHYQVAPHEETKLVYCSLGRIFDIALDLRRDSPTFCEWFAVELAPDENMALYIPQGVAHGFQTLEADSEVYYFISAKYHLASSRGVRWNDPAFRIELPLPVTVMNKRDGAYPDFVV